jgi:hypothetical protein
VGLGDFAEFVVCALHLMFGDEIIITEKELVAGSQ